MRKRCMVDTTVLARVLIKKDRGLLDKLTNRYVLYVPINVMEEVFFQILVSVVGASIDRYKFYEVKEGWEKGIGKKEVSQTINSLISLIDFGILTALDINAEIFKHSIEMCKRYSLLPNDALIAATCRFYGIRRIATFDDDFRRVKFLKVVEV